MSNHSKLIIACTIGLFSEKAKFIFMILAVGCYILKMQNLAVVSTALCFSTIITEAIIQHYIVKSEWEE